MTKGEVLMSTPPPSDNSSVDVWPNNSGDLYDTSNPIMMMEATLLGVGRFSSRQTEQLDTCETEGGGEYNGAHVLEWGLFVEHSAAWLVPVPSSYELMIGRSSSCHYDDRQDQETQNADNFDHAEHTFGLTVPFDSENVDDTYDKPEYGDKHLRRNAGVPPQLESTKSVLNVTNAPASGNATASSASADAVTKMEDAINNHTMSKPKGPAAASAEPVPTNKPVPMAPPRAIIWMCLLFKVRERGDVEVTIAALSRSENLE